MASEKETVKSRQCHRLCQLYDYAALPRWVPRRPRPSVYPAVAGSYYSYRGATPVGPRRRRHTWSWCSGRRHWGRMVGIVHSLDENYLEGEEDSEGLEEVGSWKVVSCVVLNGEVVVSWVVL